MPVDPDLVDALAATIADLYRDVEMSLIKTVAQRLRQDPPLPSPFEETKLDAIRKLQRAAAAILATLQASRAGAIRGAVADAYRSGGDAAMTDLPDLSHAARRRLPPTGIGQAAREALEQIPNARIVENLAAALHRDVARLDSAIFRAATDAYRLVQAGTAARVASGAYTRREAAQAAWQALIDRGIVDFTDRAGRRWKLSSYVEMIARTNIQRAAVQGQTDRLESLGEDLVIVSDSPRECPKCRPWEKKVLSISGRNRGKVQVEHATRDGVMVTVDIAGSLDDARRAGFQHPNCTHSVSLYTPGITRVGNAKANPDGYKAKQQQRALERKIRAAKEQAEGALDDQAKKKANAKVRAAQAALRDHLKANPKLKRLPYREQIGGGNTPRGGRPAPGGPVTGLQPPPARPTPAPPKPEPQVPPAARPYHRNLDGIEDLARRVETQRETGSRRLGGQSAQTELVTLADGTKVIRKRARTGLDDMQDAAAEHAASLLGRALGLRTPGVYRRGPGEIYMEYIEDARTAEEAAGYGGDLPKAFADAIGSDDGKRLGLLDLLTMNIDRNNGNWMLDGRGRLVPIDHGASFVNRTGDPARDREFVNNPFADHYADDGNPLTKADVTELRRRLESLRPAFEHMGRGEWLTYSLAVLDRLAPNARGTRNLFAR